MVWLLPILNVYNDADIVISSATPSDNNNELHKNNPIICNAIM